MTLCTFTHMVYDSSSVYPQPACHEFNQESEAKLGFKLKYRISTQKSQISEWSSYIQVLTDVAIDFANAKRICTKYIWHQKWLHDHRILSRPLFSEFIARHIFWVYLILASMLYKCFLGFELDIDFRCSDDEFSEGTLWKFILLKHTKFHPKVCVAE